MRNIFLLIWIILFSVGCRKGIIDKTNIPLSQIKQVYPTGNETTGFVYDNSGRIRMETSFDTDISYQPDGIFIKPPPLSNAHPGDKSEIKYILDAAKNPLKRKSFSEKHYYGLIDPEVHYNADSTNYHYDSNGMINNYDGVLADSNSYYPYPGVLSIEVEKISYRGIYTLENRNIKNVSRTLEAESKVIESGITIIKKLFVTESTDFFYDKKYPNKFDFNNTLILKELRFLPFPLYQFNYRFTNLPNKAVTTRVIKDVAGNIIKTETITEEADLTFTGQGYINTKKEGSSTKYFIYETF